MMGLFTRGFATIIVAGAGLWWLFADTYRHYYPSDETRPLRFAHFGSFEDYAFWRWVIEEFAHDCPSFAGSNKSACATIRQEYIVGGQGQYNAKMRQQILAGTLPDAALIQLAPFQELAEHFASVSELGDELGEVLDRGAMSAFAVAGVQRGIPISGGNLLIYLNTKCLDKAAALRGVAPTLPQNVWMIDDFVRLAEYLTCDFDDDGKIDQFGFWLPQWVYFLPFIWSMGADVVDAETLQWIFTGTDAENALRLYRELAVERHVSPGDAEVSQLFQDTGFLTGRVAMCVNGPWLQPFLASTELADHYEVLPIPSGEGGRWTRIIWDGVILSPPVNENRRAAAQLFVRWLCSKKIQDRLALVGKALPARMESSPSFVDADRRRRIPFVSALEYSRLPTLTPRLARMDRLLNQELHTWTTAPTQQSAADVLSRLQDHWNQLERN